MSEDAKNRPPSWDEQRANAPDRPEMSTYLPEEELIARPRRVIVAYVFVILAALGLAVFIATAFDHFEQMREALIAQLPEDLVEDYEESDIEAAANLMIIVVGGACALFMLAQVLATNAVARRRKLGGRVVLLVTAVLYLANSVIALSIRDGDATDSALIIAIAALIFLTLILIFSRRVTRWLKQNETRRYIPLSPQPLEHDS